MLMDRGVFRVWYHFHITYYLTNLAQPCQVSPVWDSNPCSSPWKGDDLNRLSNGRNCGPDENRTHLRNIASVSRRSLGTCQPINETVFRDFTDGLFLITCCVATQSRVPKQSTLGHSNFGWVATPMKPRFLSSALFGLLSVSLLKDAKNKCSIVLKNRRRWGFLFMCLWAGRGTQTHNPRLGRATL